jgi:alpha-N-acetylglucosaminidase
MGWIFYSNRKNWTDERIEAMLNGVPAGKMILLDYYCDKSEVWKMTNSFFGKPFIWCYLGNFGGNTFMSGSLNLVNERFTNALKENKNLLGIGSTLEGFDVNPVMYEFVFEKAWNPELINVENWIKDYARRRCGSEDSNVAESWKILLERIYAETSNLGQGSIITARPCLTGHGTRWTNPEYHYSNADLFRAWELMLKANINRDTYLCDLVNVACQALSNEAIAYREKMVQDYDAKDLAAFDNSSRAFLELISDVDRLLVTRPERSLGIWIRDAKEFGKNVTERKYYEQNARNILTTWGPKNHRLNDYANRSWAGLIKGFYLKRWQFFVDELRNSIITGEKFNSSAYNEKIINFEWNWTFATEVYPDVEGNSFDIAKELYQKYGSKNN